MSNFFTEIIEEEKQEIKREKEKIIIYSSYWANVRNINNISPVSISRAIPKWASKWKELENIELIYPTTRMDKEIGKMDNEKWASWYRETILSHLNPFEIYPKLIGKTILGWVGPEEFCQRGVIADWIEEETGIIIKEYGFNLKHSKITTFKQEKLF